MSESALMTDFTLGLLNKNIYESDVIKHLKKVGKSNGYKYFSFIVPSKYLKHINCDYHKKTDCFKDLSKSKKKMCNYFIKCGTVICVNLKNGLQ